MAHCAVIRRFVSIWRRGLPLQRPDIPHHKHQNPSEGVEDAIDREFNDLFDQWRKLTNEILSEPTERYEIGESVLLGKAISYPAQVNSVIGVYIGTLTHDRWAAYFSYFLCKHQVCGSHILRDLAFVIDSNGYRWARLMHKLLREGCHAVNQSEAECRRYRKRYRPASPK